MAFIISRVWFQEYDFKIVYKLGSSCLKADALNRLPNQTEPI